MAELGLLEIPIESEEDLSAELLQHSHLLSWCLRVVNLKDPLVFLWCLLEDVRRKALDFLRR